MVASVAVLSDIHGVLPALDAVLAEPDVQAAERIVLTGDIAAGPQPVQVLDRLLGLGDRVTWVRGNADRELVELGQAHAGVHRASLGWILPEVPDPDGHAMRFYTMEHHTDVAPGEVATIHDPKETAEQREREEAARA